MLIHQDNKSTIIMAVQGGTFKRTKHLIGRESFVGERIRDGDIVLQNLLGTEKMPADALTKPLRREVVKRCMQMVCVREVKKM